MIAEKIALGTANFGSPYGFFKKKLVKEDTIEKILFYCKKNKINTIETSSDYKNSEETLGRLGCKEFKIITKIPKLNNSYIGSSDAYIENKIENSLKNMKKKKLYALLFRDPQNLIKGMNINLWQTAKEYQNKGVISKIGITIYDIKELEKTFEILKPNIVQVPYNLFDRRVETTGWLDELYKKNVKVHCRSVFLQGLLLKKKNELPSKFFKYKQLWYRYHTWLKENDLTSLEACINFVCNKREISKVVLGIDNLLQLKKIVQTKKKTINLSLINSNIQEDLIDPRKW